MSDKIEDYGDSNIKVLEGLEAVRKRPGMYIGDTGITGLHHMIWEVVDNSADEALAGHGDTIEVERDEEQVISVRDYGRGIPTGINEQTGLSTVETVLTVLHAGGKFDADSYKVSGGLHGVGVSVVTALSEWVQAEVFRDGEHHKLRIEKGGTDVVEPLHVVGKSKAKETGTKISFKADPLIFKETTDYDDEMIKTRLRRSSFLTPKVRYMYKYPTEEGNIEEEFYSENGLTDYIDYVFQANPENSKLIDTFYVEKEGEFDDADKTKKNVKVKFAFTYGKEYKPNVLAFVNNIPTPEGGPHETQMYAAMRKAIGDKAKEKKLDKKLKGFSAEDIKEGLNAIIAVYVYEPQFEGQTKGKLGKNTPVSKAVYATVKDNLEMYLEENPKVLKLIVQKVELAKRAREASERSREATRKSEEDSMFGILPTKLADCRSKDPSICEIFYVEGDSAGGGAKESRDNMFQAILPLKGKVLNAYKSAMKDILKNQEIGSLITAIGAGSGKDFDITKVRYHKNIIMTDADIDGGHIGFLLVLTFMKLMRPLVEAGYLYVVIPPLHRVSKGEKSYYFFSDKERTDFFINLWKKAGKGDIPLTEKGDTDLEEISKGWLKTRFKGLGEMNPDQLEETAINPETRILKQLTIPSQEELLGDDISENNSEELNQLLEENKNETIMGLIEKFDIDDILEILGGKDSSIRRWFLMKFTSEIEVDV